MDSSFHSSAQRLNPPQPAIKVWTLLTEPRQAKLGYRKWTLECLSVRWPLSQEPLGWSRGRSIIDKLWPAALGNGLSQGPSASDVVAEFTHVVNRGEYPRLGLVQDEMGQKRRMINPLRHRPLNVLHPSDGIAARAVAHPRGIRREAVVVDDGREQVKPRPEQEVDLTVDLDPGAHPTASGGLVSNALCLENREVDDPTQSLEVRDQEVAHDRLLGLPLNKEMKPSHGQTESRFGLPPIRFFCQSSPSE